MTGRGEYNFKDPDYVAIVFTGSPVLVWLRTDDHIPPLMITTMLKDLRKHFGEHVMMATTPKDWTLDMLDEDQLARMNLQRIPEK